MTAWSVDIPDSENQVIGRADAAVSCSLLATAAHCNRVEERIRVYCDAERQVEGWRRSQSTFLFIS